MCLLTPDWEVNRALAASVRLIVLPDRFPDDAQLLKIHIYYSAKSGIEQRVRCRAAAPSNPFVTRLCL